MFDIEDGASMHTNKFKTIQTYVCKLIPMSGQSRSDSFIERKYETSHKEVFRSRKLPEVKALLQAQKHYTKNWSMRYYQNLATILSHNWR